MITYDGSYFMEVLARDLASHPPLRGGVDVRSTLRLLCEGAMTVYVDDMYRFAMGRFRRMKMSHMIADTPEEPHAMAAQIGIARKWYQGDHYDICISKRELAIANGARAITMRELAAIARAARAAAGADVAPPEPNHRTLSGEKDARHGPKEPKRSPGRHG